MASALIENLSAASALATTDLFYVKQAGARGLKATGAQLLALVGTAYVPLAGGAMTGPLLAADGSKTAPSLSFGSGSTIGLYYRAGFMMFAGSSKEIGQLSSSGILSISQIGFPSVVGTDFSGSGYSSLFGADTTANFVGLYGAPGTSAQGLRIYGLRSDVNNYERLTLSTTAGSSVNITAETLGTGGDNLDVVITPAGTGGVAIPAGLTATPGLKFAGTNAGFWYDSGAGLIGIRGYNATNPDVGIGNGVFRLKSAQSFGWSSGTDPTTTGTDTGMHRNAAGIIEVNNGVLGTWRDLKLRNLLAGGGNGSYVQTPSMTVANLAAAATAGAGARAFVTDANATTFLSTVAAGGSNKVPVVSDGTNWLIG